MYKECNSSSSVSHPVRILNPPGVHVTPNELGGNVEVEAAERFADPKSSLGNAICVVRSSRLRYKFTAVFFWPINLDPPILICRKAF